MKDNQVDTFGHMVEDLVEDNLLPEVFMQHVDGLRNLIAKSLIQHTENYEYALGIKTPPPRETTRKLYAISYKVLASETNPESVSGRIINFGVEGANILDATDYFLSSILAKGTEVDIIKVELEQTFETAEEVQEALNKEPMVESLNDNQ